MKYVKGEIEERSFVHVGISSTGIKIPLMNTSGNLIVEDSIITLVGVSVGGKPIKID